jgi:hypothetical protein
MKRGRSPNYPQLTLAEAIEKARLIFSEEHFHTASREVIAKDMGFQGLSGPSQSHIAALKHYGLLTAEGDGLRVSEDAVTLLELEENEPRRQQALARAAVAPHLFREIIAEFGPELPSDANLRHWLLKRNFLSKAADETIRIFRDNLTIAKDAVGRYTDGMGKFIEQEPIRSGRSDQPREEAPLKRQTETNAKPNQLATQVLAISIPRNLSIDIAVKGDELKKEDLAKIKSQFNRWIEGLEEAFEE